MNHDILSTSEDHPACMCLCFCTCFYGLYACMHACLRAYMHPAASVYVSVYVHFYGLYGCMYARLRACMHALMLYIQKRYKLNICIGSFCVCMHAHDNSCTSRYVSSTYIHTHIHTYIHTHESFPCMHALHTHTYHI
jgi:hypothetical protein